MTLASAVSTAPSGPGWVTVKRRSRSAQVQRAKRLRRESASVGVTMRSLPVVSSRIVAATPGVACSLRPT